ncbi:MAG: type II toxin-antitoxin system HicB family antitoxin [bacterium]|nr:type II toxin-antitoxin system HicB family antitoxin [bacterium]
MGEQKIIKKQKVYNFTAFFEPAEEGGYVVSVPALPGCLTQGETFEEAQAMAKDAIEVYLQTLCDLKEEIPLESERMVISKIPANVCFS